MTVIATVSLSLMILSAIGTVVLMAVPVVPRERALWHALRIERVRRWITQRRKVDQPLHNGRTIEIARTNLRWHLVLTMLMCFLTGRAMAAEWWWLPLPAAVLVLPALAYLLGSIVQRQKIAILVARRAGAKPSLR